MSATGIDVQSALMQKLRGSAELAAIVGTRIWDDVPHSQEAIDTSFPRITVDGQSETEAGADTVDMSEFRVLVHAYSRALGKKQCQEMMHLIRNAVIGQHAENTHRAETGKLVLFMFDFSDGPRREADNKTYHGVIRFKGLIQY